MQFIHKPIHIPEITADIKHGIRHYNCNGNEYPSITSVLGYGPKEFLIEWRERLGEEAADVETKRCADRGTAVHAMCENYLNNTEIGEYSPFDIKLFKKLKYVLRNINNIAIQEVGLYSDALKVAGRVDCIAEYKGVLSIIDFKTSNNVKTDEMCNDYFLQETFYSLALLEGTGIDVEQIVTIIAVERQMNPQVFIKNRNNYISELNKRIEKFYLEFKGE
jgi:genome maintenance exonuclease 1